MQTFHYLGWQRLSKLGDWLTLAGASYPPKELTPLRSIVLILDPVLDPALFQRLNWRGKLFRKMASNDGIFLSRSNIGDNLKSAVYDFHGEKDFSDATLVCEDNQIEAHKVFLAAGSSFFKKILEKNPHPHPLIKGIESCNMEAVLKKFGEAEQESLLKELGQHHDLKTFFPLYCKKLDV